MSHSVSSDTLHVIRFCFLFMGTAPSLASHPIPWCRTEVLQVTATESPYLTTALCGLSWTGHSACAPVKHIEEHRIIAYRYCLPDRLNTDNQLSHIKTYNKITSLDSWWGFGILSLLTNCIKQEIQTANKKNHVIEDHRSMTVHDSFKTKRLIDSYHLGNETKKFTDTAGSL